MDDDSFADFLPRKPFVRSNKKLEEERKRKKTNRILSQPSCSTKRFKKEVEALHCSSTAFLLTPTKQEETSSKNHSSSDENSSQHSASDTGLSCDNETKTDQNNKIHNLACFKLSYESTQNHLPSNEPNESGRPPNSQDKIDDVVVDTKWSCVICKKPFPEHLRAAHLSECIKTFEHKDKKTNDAMPSEENLPIMCSICKIDISLLTISDRFDHVNSCLDNSMNHVENTVTTASSESTVVAINECPLCFKKCSTSEARLIHIKKCSRARGMNAQRVFNALQLQLKHVTERVAAGLMPLMPEKNASSRQAPALSRKYLKKPKSKADADIQLAKALSLSIEEEKIQVDNKEAEASEQFLHLPPPENGQMPGKKKKKKDKDKPVPFLVLQTEEDRHKLLEERVSAIILSSLTCPSESAEDKVCDESALCIQSSRTVNSTCEKSSKKEFPLWCMSGIAADKSDYYVTGLMEFVSVSDIEAGSKLLNLSQLPGHHIYTQHPCDFTFSVTQDSNADSADSTIPSTQEMVDIIASQVVRAECNTDERTNCLVMTDHKHEYSNTNGGFIEQRSPSAACENPVTGCLESLVGNMWMSDVDINLANGEMIPAHKLLLVLRCPSVRDILDNSDNSRTSLNWDDISHEGAWNFLNFVYTGNRNWPSSIDNEVANLVERCGMKNPMPTSAHKDQETDPIICSPKFENIEASVPITDEVHIDRSGCGQMECEEDDISIISAQAASVDEKPALLTHQEETEECNDIKHSFIKNESSNEEEDDCILMNPTSNISDWKKTMSIPNEDSTFSDKENVTVASIFAAGNDRANTPSLHSNMQHLIEESYSLQDAKEEEYNDISTGHKVRSFQNESLNSHLPSEGDLSDENNITEICKLNQCDFSPEGKSPRKLENLTNLEVQASYCSRDPKAIFEQSTILIPKQSSSITSEYPSKYYSSNLVDADQTALFSRNSFDHNSFSEITGDNMTDDLEVTVIFDKKHEEALSKIHEAEHDSTHGSSPDLFVYEDKDSESVHESDDCLSIEGDAACDDLENPQEGILLMNDSQNIKPVFCTPSPFKLNHTQTSRGSNTSPILLSSGEDCESNECNDLNTENAVSGQNEMKAPATAVESTSISGIISPSKNSLFRALEPIQTHTPISTRVGEKSSDEEEEFLPLLERIIRRKEKEKRRVALLERNNPVLATVDIENDERCKSPLDSKTISDNNTDSVLGVMNFENGMDKGTPTIHQIQKSHDVTGVAQKSIPLAPEVSIRISDSPITPLPDFKSMFTPDIKNALQKYGIRPLPRKKAVAVLTHIYDETHPFTENGETMSSKGDSHLLPTKTSEANKPATRKRTTDTQKKNTKVIGNNKQNKKVKLDIVISPGKNTHDNEENSNQEPHNSSQTSSQSDVSDTIEGLVFTSDDDEDNGASASQKIQTSILAKEKVKNYIRGNKTLYSKILMYEPLNLMDLHHELKESDIKISTSGLMDLLDEQCITFSAPRNEKYQKKQNARVQKFRKKMIAREAASQQGTQSTTAITIV